MDELESPNVLELLERQDRLQAEPAGRGTYRTAGVLLLCTGAGLLAVAVLLALGLMGFAVSTSVTVGPLVVGAAAVVLGVRTLRAHRQNRRLRRELRELGYGQLAEDEASRGLDLPISRKHQELVRNVGIVLSIVLPALVFVAVGGSLGTAFLAVVLLGPPVVGILRNLSRRS